MKYFNMEPFVYDYDGINDLYFKSSDNIYDMHNDADFFKIEYDVLEGKIILKWKYPSKWFLNDSSWWGNKEYLKKANIVNKSQFHSGMEVLIEAKSITFYDTKI